MAGNESDPDWQLPPPPPGPAPSLGNSEADKIQRQVTQQAGIVAPGATGGTIFDQPVLVVNQKVKLVELTNEYKVFDQYGNQIGSVCQIGQGIIRKLLRLLTEVDQFLSLRLEIRDVAGSALLTLTRPAKIFKSRFIVTGPSGAVVGNIRQENMIGKIKFALEANGSVVGRIQAENWRAWNFSISDTAGAEIARVTKTWEGLAKTMFTSADNYVVQVHAPLAEPLRSLVLAAALCIDTALKQDSRGLN